MGHSKRLHEMNPEQQERERARKRLSNRKSWVEKWFPLIQEELDETMEPPR